MDPTDVEWTSSDDTSPVSLRIMPLMKCKIHRLTCVLEGESVCSDTFFRDKS